MLAHQSGWAVEPQVLAVLAVAGLAYKVRARQPGRRAVAFYAGLALLAATVMSPVVPFSAHMAQHLVLMLVVAPLLVYGWPVPALARVHPIVVWVAGTVALWAWHMPSLYDLAFRHHAVHALEHASFLGTTMLFWAVVMEGAVARPIAALLVFATGVQGSALGAFLVFASAALYPVHATRANALADQQLAGALMWGPPAIVYIVLMAWLLYRWFAEMDSEPSTVLAGAPQP